MLQSSIQVANWDGNAAHRENHLKHVRLSVTILGRHALQKSCEAASQISNAVNWHGVFTAA